MNIFLVTSSQLIQLFLGTLLFIQRFKKKIKKLQGANYFKMKTNTMIRVMMLER